MDYCIINQDGVIFAIHSGNSSIRVEVDRIKRTYPYQEVYVEFMCYEDGQTVYLNPNMDHSIIGHSW